MQMQRNYLMIFGIMLKKNFQKQLKDLITPLTQLVEKLEEIGFSETEDEKKQRQNYSVILKEKSNQSLEEFSANRAKNCESFDALIKGVERDVATLKMGNLAVKKIFDLIDNYVNNKRVSMLKSLIEQMQYYVDNEDYGKCYDCYAIAFEKFAK